jgi:catechol 2,3-dioxygenase-like lactoylglutathione lyase family enzyme
MPRCPRTGSRKPSNIPFKAAWFDVGGDQAIHVLEVEDFCVPAGDREYGRHLAFAFPESQWTRIQQQLEQAGVEKIDPLRDSGGHRFFVRDPNGYCFEFVCR